MCRVPVRRPGARGCRELAAIPVGRVGHVVGRLERRGERPLRPHVSPIGRGSASVSRNAARAAIASRNETSPVSSYPTDNAWSDARNDSIQWFSEGYVAFAACVPHEGVLDVVAPAAGSRRMAWVA